MTDDTPELPSDQADEVWLVKIAERTGVTVSMLKAQPNDVLLMMQQIYGQTQNDPSAFQSRIKQLFRIQDISPIKTVEEAVEQNPNCHDNTIDHLPLAAKSGTVAVKQKEEPFYLTRQRLAAIAAAAKRANMQREEDNSRQDTPERKQTGGS